MIIKKEQAIFGGILILLFAPQVIGELFPFILFIGIGLLIIAFSRKNPVLIFLGLTCYSSLSQVILWMVSSNEVLHSKIEASVTLISVASMETIIDIIVFTETAQWSTFTHLLVGVLTGSMYYLIIKKL